MHKYEASVGRYKKNSVTKKQRYSFINSKKITTVINKISIDKIRADRPSEMPRMALAYLYKP